jgi:ERO1-like protein alpha
MRLSLALLPAVLALVSCSGADASSAQPPASVVTWRKLFPQDMYEYLQCQVCQTPELHGSVGDSGCNYETVDKAVAQHFHPLLLELTQLTFFRYFKVDLGRECPYWQDDGMCASRDCAVCECPSDEIPPMWSHMDQQEREQKQKQKKQMSPCDDPSGESELSRVDRKNAAAGTTFRGWTEAKSANVWTSPTDSDDNMVYINLLENPERFTGYSGYQAERIWQAIYQENCFLPPSGQEKELTGMCLEERVYYRLISGLQSSINTHIALRYKHSNYWGTNLGLFVHRVGKHPERIQNLYFTYLFVMRALGRFRNELLSYEYATGNDKDDARVREILAMLVSETEKEGASSCPTEQQSVLTGFDERALFQVKRGGMSYDQFRDAKQQKQRLERQFRDKFQNVSRIMDCVTCEKCRLWGKLQTMGLGTAIKILLADDVRRMPTLHRNELIALVNVANNLARSVDGVRMFRNLEFAQAMQQLAGITLGAIVVVVALVVVIRKRKAARLAVESAAKKTQ